ncbi:AMP-binding protein [Haloactinospora alba]|uniref:AMP-binding protein n=1 Tax=Haloactinospora alba TaxID=405555 RepID=UPI00114E4808|nr:AMP-binding protein [Haloactinospora alba]
MATRSLQAVSGVDPERFTALLSDALRGDGPALLPLDHHLPRPRIDALLQTMRPDSLRTPDGVTQLDGGEPVADDTAVVVATSGSTEAPKGVELSADALLRSARASIDRIGAGPQDTWLCVLPLPHIAGLQVVVRALVNGGRVLHPSGSGTEAITAAAGESPHVSLVPTQLRRLLTERADLSRFPTILLGGAAADEGLLTAAREAGGRVITTYGMSETCGGCVYDGIPLDGTLVRLDEADRVLLSGPTLFSGYRRDPRRTRAHRERDAEGGVWFRTGDVGRFGADGALEVRGRADEVINTGGYKVVPGEVAALVNRLDSVHDTVVVGRPDEEWGERVTAVVVPSRADAPPTLREVRAWVRERMPSYAAPRELELRSAIPLLSSGKPDLTTLRSPATMQD